MRTVRHAAARRPTMGGTPRLFFVVVGLCLAIAALVAAVTLSGPKVPTQSDTPRVPRALLNPFRAFSPGSWWNTPLPDDAPQNPAAESILSFLRTAPESGDGCLKLAGAGDSPWGQPIYWARPSDPTYDVQGIENNARPPELDELRIPAGAQPPDNSDGSMSIFDRAQGYVTLLTDAAYDLSSDTWTASGATVTYLDSNGLDVRTGRSDDPDNIGTHRGNNGATSVVRWDMVQAGVIDNVLKVAAGPEIADRWVFPMVGSDGHYAGTDPAVPPQGLRLRISPSVNLDVLNLQPQALIIARALQQYGFYIGDSGNVTALKLEDTMSEGRGQLWTLGPHDLCGLPFTSSYWDVIAEGYDPSRDR